MDPLSRREFLALAASFAAAPSLQPFVPKRLHIALIHSPFYATAAKAAAMSAREAQRAASLLKRELQFSTVLDTKYTRAQPAWTAVIVATRRRLELPRTLPVVDIANDPNCDHHYFFLRPATKLALWHASLERFGAAQLNDRFRAARIPIDDQAWLGWFAVKMLWEAGVRGKALDSMSFDGHKGRALTFGRTPVLMQPLYQLSADNTKVAAERLPLRAEYEIVCY
jgi:hypothetical protein